MIDIGMILYSNFDHREFKNVPVFPGGKRKCVMDKKYMIAVAETGYVCLES